MAEEKAAAAAAPAEPKVAKSNMILIVIIAVLVTILVGGGAAAFFMMKKGGESAEEEHTAAAEATPTDDKGGKKKGGKEKEKKEAPKGPAIYVGLEPPFVVNFDGNQASRFLQVTVEVMTRDAATAQLVKDNDPMVRNDLLLLFGSQDAAVLATRDGKEGLRKQTLDTVKALVKAEGGTPTLVENVFFTTFVMQ